MLRCQLTKGSASGFVVHTPAGPAAAIRSSVSEALSRHPVNTDGP